MVEETGPPYTSFALQIPHWLKSLQHWRKEAEMAHVERAGHMMLSIGTWGTSSRAVVVEMGAVVFDPLGKLLDDVPVTTDIFYSLVSPESCLKLGMEVEANTILWWMAQDEESRHRFTRAQELQSWKPIHQALDSLSVWMALKEIKYVWAHRAGFDPTLITEYYRRLGKPLPFNFRDIRDTRTLYSLYNLTEEEWKVVMRRSMKHHPVYDAWAQARSVQYCLQLET
jgi:hypothetical protein